MIFSFPEASLCYSYSTWCSRLFCCNTPFVPGHVPLARSCPTARRKLASLCLYSITHFYFHHYTYHSLTIHAFPSLSSVPPLQKVCVMKAGILLTSLSSVFSIAQNSEMQWSLVNTYRMAGWLPGRLDPDYLRSMKGISPRGPTKAGPGKMCQWK